MFTCRSCNSNQTVAAIAQACNHMRCLNCFVRLIGMQPDGMTFVCQDCQRSSVCIIAADLANCSTFQLAAKNGIVQIGGHCVQAAIAMQCRQFLAQNYPGTVFGRIACQQPNPNQFPQPAPQQYPSTSQEENTRFNQLLTQMQRDVDSPIEFDPFSPLQFRVDDGEANDSPDTQPEYEPETRRCRICGENVENLPAHNAQRAHAACECCTKLVARKRAFAKFQMWATQQAAIQHMRDDHAPCWICGNFFETHKVLLAHKRDRHPAQFTEEDRINLANQPPTDRRDIRDLLKQFRQKYPQ